MTMHKRVFPVKTLIFLAALLIFAALTATTPALAAERTGNTWILPVTNCTDLGCDYGCETCRIKGDDGKVYHSPSIPHPGYDIRGAKGTPIVAPRSGRVVDRNNSCKGSHYAAKNRCTCGKTSGNFVKIKHTDGTYTVYFHMTATAVMVNDWVDQGDVIGYVGETGNASGCHVCMETRESSGTAGRTDLVNTIVKETAVKDHEEEKTTYRPSLRLTTRNAALWSSPVEGVQEKVGTIPKNSEILCTIIQENYGFVEYEGMKGWVNLPDNTEFLKNAVQLDYWMNGADRDTNQNMRNATHVVGEDIELPLNAFEKSGSLFSYWTVYRPYSKKYLYTDGTDWGWYTNKKQPAGWSYYKIPDGGTVPAEVFAKDNAGIVIQLRAHWVDADAARYTVRYDGGGSVPVVLGSMEDTAGTRGVKDPIAYCEFVKPGYVFTGWTASRASDGKWLYRVPEDGVYKSKYVDPDEAEAAGWKLYVYPDGGATTSPTSVDGDVITLHAQWSSLAMILNPENGSSRPAYAPIQENEPLGELAIPQKEGHHFLGWFTEDGEQVTSLTVADADLQSVNQLYAHWLPHEDRPVLERYLSQNYMGNQYTQALSQLLVASGQQEDGVYDAAQCYEDLDSVGMIGPSGGVKNGSFVSSGFLEYFGPELTYEGGFTCDSYEDYVSELAKKQEEGYYVLVKLDLGKDETRWVYLYEADGESLLVAHNGQIADAADVAEGIANTNLFLYHGSEFYTQRPCLEGTYAWDGETLEVELSCSAAELEEDRQTLWIACYAEERLAAFRQTTVRLDSYRNGSVSVDVEEPFDHCRAFILDDQQGPLCEAILLQEQ